MRALSAAEKDLMASVDWEGERSHQLKTATEPPYDRDHWAALSLATRPRPGTAHTLAQALGIWRRVSSWWHYTPGELARIWPETARFVAREPAPATLPETPAPAPGR